MGRQDDRGERERGSSSTRGGAARRGGYGDDQGTRVGSPTPSGREDGQPSTHPVNEGLEGAIMDEDQDEGGRTAGAPTESGAEAARGIHEQGSGGDTKDAGGVTSDRGVDEGGRSGSEPIRGRTREHESGYGGSADKPKTSSDQREPLDPEGDAGAGKR